MQVKEKMREHYQHKENKKIYTHIGFVSPFINSNDVSMVFVPINNTLANFSPTVEVYKYDINKTFNIIRTICRLKKK